MTSTAQGLTCALVGMAFATIGATQAMACPGDAPATAAAQAQLVAQLAARADAWDKAIVTKNRAAIAANMADDFRQIDGRGEVETKDTFVAGLIDPDLSIAPYAVEEFDVRLYGNTALLSGRTNMTGHYQGKAFASAYRYIDIYVCRDREWKIVSVQITLLPKPATAK